MKGLFTWKISISFHVVLQNSFPIVYSLLFIWEYWKTLKQLQVVLDCRHIAVETDQEIYKPLPTKTN